MLVSAPMVKIKNYKVSRAGRGLKVTLPQTWINDVGASAGSVLTLYRDTEDRLVIVKEDRK